MRKPSNGVLKKNRINRCLEKLKAFTSVQDTIYHESYQRDYVRRSSIGRETNLDDIELAKAYE